MPPETATSPRSICAALNRPIRARVDDASAQTATVRLYLATFELPLPNDARTVVAQQHERIARDEANLRRKSFLR